MGLTSTAPRGSAVVNNQHRDQANATDSRFLEEAIQKLRVQMQLAGGGWSAEPSADGRTLIGSGSPAFREVLIETHGPSAVNVQQYLLSMEPGHTRELLALLEDLQRSISTDTLNTGTRRAAVRYAERILGRKRAQADRGRRAP